MEGLRGSRHDTICPASCLGRSERSLCTFAGFKIGIELLCETLESIDHLAVFVGDIALLADVLLKIKEGNLRLLLAIGTGDAILAGLVSKAAIGVVEMQGPLPRADRFKLVAPVEEIGFMRAFCL